MQEGRSFDAYYNSNLSDDAVPVLLENLNEMSFDAQCVIKHKFLYRLQENRDNMDFRSWNWSRRTSGNEIENNVDRFNTASCPEYTLRFNFHHGFD